MIDRVTLKKTLDWSSNQRQTSELDRVFDGPPEPPPLSPDQAGAEMEALKAKRRDYQARTKAMLDAKLRHKFSDDGREYYVAGMKVWKNDVQIIWKPVREETFDHVAGIRVAITERSRAARKRLSFTVSNTETVIVGMIVLTWKIAPMDGKIVKRQLGDLFDALRRQIGKAIEWLWWLEFQKRGAPHIHILTAGSVHDDFQTVRRWRRRKWRNIYTGQIVDWLGQKWLKIIKADKCEASQKFTRGGIWEKFDKPDGAARYCAKDAWKPHQTKVPEQYQNVGAWWHRSRGFKSPELLAELHADEYAIRRGLNLEAGEKLFPVLFGKTKQLKAK